MQILANEKQQMVLQIEHFKLLVGQLDKIVDAKMKETIGKVGEKIRKWGGKIEKMRVVFEETLKYSNKTHYMEEVNRLRN